MRGSASSAHSPFRPTSLIRDAGLPGRIAGLPARSLEPCWMLEAVKPRRGDPPATCAGYNWADTASRDGAAASAAAFFVRPGALHSAARLRLCLRRPAPYPLPRSSSPHNTSSVGFVWLFFLRAPFRFPGLRKRRENSISAPSFFLSTQNLLRRSCVVIFCSLHSVSPVCVSAGKTPYPLLPFHSKNRYSEMYGIPVFISCTCCPTLIYYCILSCSARYCSDFSKDRRIACAVAFVTDVLSASNSSHGIGSLFFSHQM